MQKYLIALAFLAMSANIALAQENEQEELNAFGYPDKSLVTVIEATKTDKQVKINPKPFCNDGKLIKQAQLAIKEYMDKALPTIYAKRKNRIIIKNVNNFVPLKLDDVSAEKYPRVAGRMVELKINNHLDDQNIAVCQNDSPELDAKLYLIMYDDDDKVKVDIVNYSDNKIPNFIYNDE